MCAVCSRTTSKSEANYFKKTGIFPIMHSVAIRQELWEEHPWIARSLFKAFQRAKEDAYARLNDTSPIRSAWHGSGVLWRSKEPFSAMTRGPTGLRKNRHVVSTLMSYLYEQGLAREKIEVEKSFSLRTRWIFNRLLKETHNASLRSIASLQRTSKYASTQSILRAPCL